MSEKHPPFVLADFITILVCSSAELALFAQLPPLFLMILHSMIQYQIKSKWKCAIKIY